MTSWEKVTGKENWFEHFTEVGTFLYFEDGLWIVERGGRVVGQNKKTSNPFRWAEDVVRRVLDHWS